jgi:hypothetical protein
MNKKQQQKRKFLKKAAYVVPAVLTLTAVPSFASSGSGSKGSPIKPQKKKKLRGKLR